MLLLKIMRYWRNNGLALTVKESWQRIFNKIFNLTLVWGRTDIKIDSSARIIGLCNIKIGKNFYSGKNLWLEAVVSHENEKYSPSIVIKDNVACNDYVHIGATNYVEIGNNVLMASNIYISDHNHGSYSGSNQSLPSKPPNQRRVNNDCSTIIEDNVWIGESVCILPGVRIGSGSVIGAGSVVTKDIPNNCIAVGNPAKVIKQYDFNGCQWVNVKIK